MVAETLPTARAHAEEVTVGFRAISQFFRKVRVASKPLMYYILKCRDPRPCIISSTHSKSMVDATKSGGAFAVLAFALELKLYQTTYVPRAIGMGPEGKLGRSLSNKRRRPKKRLWARGTSTSTAREVARGWRSGRRSSFDLTVAKRCRAE